MKSIINGRIYDTDKSVKICDINVGNVSDFSHFEAELFQTPRSKKFFLAGSGGPMTVFARRVDQNSTSGGSGIIPLTEEDALRYAERYASVETVQRFFEIEEA